MVCINTKCAGWDFQQMVTEYKPGVVRGTWKYVSECPLCHCRAFKILVEAKPLTYASAYDYKEEPMEFENQGLQCERCTAVPSLLYTFGIWILCATCKDARHTLLNTALNDLDKGYKTAMENDRG